MAIVTPSMMSGVSLAIPVTSRTILVNCATGFSSPVTWAAPIHRWRHVSEQRTCLTSWEGKRTFFNWPTRHHTKNKQTLNYFSLSPNKLSFDPGYRRCCLGRSQHFHSRHGARTKVQSRWRQFARKPCPAKRPGPNEDGVELLAGPVDVVGQGQIGWFVGSWFCQC